MNALAIAASPRRRGLVSTMARRMPDGAASSGHQMELVNLYDSNWKSRISASRLRSYANQGCQETFKE